MNPTDTTQAHVDHPQGPWIALEAMPGLSACRVDWRKWAGAQFDALSALCLQSTNRFAQSYTCPRHCSCVHYVIMSHDRASAVAACRCEPPVCPDVPLTLEDITPLEMSWTRLGRALCKAFGFNSRFTKLGPPSTAQFGVWGPDLVPAILTIQFLPGAFRTAVAELVADLGKPFILLAPTGAFIDARCQSLLQRCGAAFFPLVDTVTLSPGGILTPTRPPSELFAPFVASKRSEDAPQPSTINSQPSTTCRYLLRKGLGAWKLIFDGQEAILKHERGIFYVAWLLYNPPEHPIHAIDLMAKIPEIYRQQLGLAPLVDPVTGKTAALQSGARIQERSLALDDAQAMRTIYKKEKELEAILDSDDASEPEKAEALRELEELTEFQKHHARRSKDAAHRAVSAVRQSIKRFHAHLAAALEAQGAPHPVLRPFAEHLRHCLLTPSLRNASAGPHRGTAPAGSFTYQPSPAIHWSF